MPFLRFIVKYPWVVVALVVLVTAAALQPVSTLQFENSSEMWLEKDDPSVAAYEDYRAEFQSDDYAFVAWTAPGGVLGEHNIEMTSSLVAEIEQLEGVLRVTAITNMEEIRAEDDLLKIDKMVNLPLDDAERARILKKLTSDPLYAGTVTDPEGQISLMAVKIAGPDAPVPVRMATMDRIKAVLGTHDGVEFKITGLTEFDIAFWQAFVNDFYVLLGLMFVVFLIVLGVLFRSFSGVLLPSLTVGLSLVWTLGIMGLAGYMANMSTPMLAVILLALGVADSVHMICEYQEELANGRERAEAIVEAARSVFIPCLFTSLTTALGFLGLELVRVPPLREFGLLAAVGALMAFVVTYTLVPAVLRLLPPPVVLISAAEGGDSNHRSRFLHRAFSLATQHRYLVVGASLAFMAIGLAGLPYVRVSANWYDYLESGHPIIEATDFIEDKVGGVHSIELLFESRDAEGSEGIKNPAGLAELAALQVKLQADPDIERTISPADFVRDMNRAFHGGDQRWLKVPESRAEVAQYLLMYEMDAPDGEFYSFVSFDFSRARMSILTRMSAVGVHERVVKDVREQIADFEFFDVTATGLAVLYSDMEEHLINGLVRGFTASFIAVMLVMMLLLRSPRHGLLAMIPGALPIAFVLGLTGWLGVGLGTLPVMMGNVVLGIAVDNAIHVLVRYRRQRARGLLPPAAIERAITVVGRPVMFTTVVLCLGFLVLAFSEMAMSRHFGLMAAAVLCGSLVAAIVTVPATVLISDERVGARQRRKAESAGPKLDLTGR
ncbi:MAG: MMPL family transporter [Deltaproteobacteria bacterium]